MNRYFKSNQSIAQQLNPSCHTIFKSSSVPIRETCPAELTGLWFISP